jgi:HSP20 family protein
MLWNQRFGLATFDPWLDLQRLQTNLQQLAGDDDARARAGFPAIDLWSHAAGLELRAVMPGVDAADLEIDVAGTTLTLKAERRADAVAEGDIRRRRERRPGRFERVVELPHEVDIERVRAKLSNGILSITLPRAPQVGPRRIPVQPS